jgi:Pregnancy-associated plasma protein-A
MQTTPPHGSMTPRRKCGAMEALHRLLEDYPDFRLTLGDLEHLTRARLAQALIMPTEPVIIPVVVHVVYRTPDERISPAQVTSQIDALNRDFRLDNADRANIPRVWSGLATDSLIQFALARKDPSGAATSGITYTQTQTASFTTDDSVKSSQMGGADAWPRDQYLNLWVCTLRGGLLGYAQFPGGPAATDGVVILNTAFGTTGTATAPFNLGRTATHEVGHWLNLRHIWGDTEDCTGSDFVDDTPNAQHPNYDTPTFPHISCDNGPSGDMFMNYMDYVDDAVMVMFTAGQVARMQATLSSARDSITTTAASLTS